MIQTFENELYKINVYITNDSFYFKGKEIATFLGHVNTKKAIIDHVKECDKIKFSELKNQLITPGVTGDPQTIFINESGIISLIRGTTLIKSNDFKYWLTSHVIPSLNSSMKLFSMNKIININNESDLHIAVVK